MNESALAQSVPIPGQLVSVRQRRFVVSDVIASALSPSALSLSVIRHQGPQHLVQLQSVEDDGLGEVLQVIWELEPGAIIYERATLPDPRRGFDDPRRLDAFLDAVRWGAVASADVKQLNAPFRSGITIEDYQLDPVVRALQMPRVSLLIADDVGLGKTIEAGLVAQELILRHRASRILVVCPAGLQIQWRDQMQGKFGLEFRIVDSELMRQLRRRRGLRTNPWMHYPRLITSIDFLKRERPMRLMREVLPPEGQSPFPRKFDLLILDEAHNVAPAGRGHYAVDSDRTRAIRALVPHVEHKLFLSATPHNGYTESFSALLELLDDQRFHREAPLDKAQLAAVMVRRMKSQLPPNDLGEQRFPKRHLAAIPVSHSDEERQAHRDLQRYTQLRQAGAGDATEKFATEFVLKLLKKRLLSSPEAFRSTLEKHTETMRTGGRRALPVHARPTLSVLRRAIDATDEDDADDELFEERNLEAVATTSRVFRAPSDEEQALLDGLLAWARGAARRADSKARCLIDWLHATLRPGGKWNDQRVILFTEYRATQRWLEELLAAERFTHDGRLQLLYGGMKTEDREAVKAAFQAQPDDAEVRILLATDAASEGIDLQNHCRRLIHYEIPWNPNRMEQRNGRIDRHGQSTKRLVEIFHFVPQGFDRDALVGREPGDLDGDLEFLMRAALKVDQIREDLGSAGDVLARNVEEAMLGRVRTLRDPLKDNRRAVEARKMLQFQQQIDERLQRLREKLRESREELRLSPENVETVVQVAMDLVGQPPLRATTIPLAKGGDGGNGAKGKETLPAWRLPPLGGTWAPCSEGLEHPHTKVMRPITFDHTVAAGRDDVVLAHLNHRLVQMCLRLLRAEVWAPEGVAKLSRVSARVVPDALLEHPALIAHGRLVVLGSDSSRLHEEVITAGGVLREGRFQRMNVGETKAAFDAARDPRARAASADVCQRLADRFLDHEPSVTAALDARMADQRKSLAGKLQDRSDQEVANLRLILAELRRSILSKLDEEPPRQIDWLAPERDQRERNRESLRLRADQIPAEMEREAEAIRKRFEGPTARLFPVALNYVVPARLARS